MSWCSVSNTTKVKLFAILDLVQIEKKTEENHSDLKRLWAWEKKSPITRKNIPQEIINEKMGIETEDDNILLCCCEKCRRENGRRNM